MERPRRLVERLDGLAIDFVLVVDRANPVRITSVRVRDGRVRTNIGNHATFADAAAAWNPSGRRKDETIIRVRT